MAALDTNVLVRYLVEDHAEQLAQVRQLLDQASLDGQPLFVPVTVLLELEWVLRSACRLAKAEVVLALRRLSRVEEMSVDCEQAVGSALDLYRLSSVDFADCLHLAIAAQAGESPLCTFDRALGRLTGALQIAAAERPVSKKFSGSHQFQ